MSSVQPPSPVSRCRRNTAEGRLRDALVQFPRSLFCSEEPKHESELREPPEHLTVVTMIEALELVGTERVLELGSPTAYTAAVLSHLAAEVYSAVSEQGRAEQRGRDLYALGCRNVHIVFSPPQAGTVAASAIDDNGHILRLKLAHTGVELLNRNVDRARDVAGSELVRRTDVNQSCACLH